MRKILICEDEESIREFVMINLTRAGYEVTPAGSGEEALEIYSKGGYDMLLLDVMLPGIDGFTVCKRVREKDDSCGIIMLSAKSQEMDRVNGLMLGADDYITKPFSPTELLARVDALFRRLGSSSRTSAQKETELHSGPFVLNIRSRTLTRDGKPIDLTQVEFQLMEQFLRHPNIALERSQLLTTVWGDSYYGDDKIVDVNMRRLRMKVEPFPSEPKYLTTVWGFGYKWVEESR